MSNINGTHYNLIDTFHFAFGSEMWHRICGVLWIRLNDLIPENDCKIYSECGINSADILNWAREIQDAPLFTNLNFRIHHIYTLAELFVWAKIEGNYYGFGKRKDFVFEEMN